MGTPAELRSRMHAKRLELRTANLGEAERILSAVSGSEQDILDVQRFGDRLDLLTHDPEAARRVLDERLGAASKEVMVDNPTLENTFVSTLRSLGQEMHETPFPGHHDHLDLRGRVAIGAKNLTMQFGSFTAVKDICLEVRYGEIYGLLGANGAGKTTTIKMLCGLLDPTGGEIELAGARGGKNSAFAAGAAACIGYMSQENFRSTTI